MQTKISATQLASADGQEANRILRSCVHCGFCNATCPTYQQLGDELDGPRGRIYLIKDMLEGGDVSTDTQEHLDRCLSCRACESTCPSGVEFTHLADIGKGMIDQRVQRPLRQRLLRSLLLNILPYRARFARLIAVARLLRPFLPQQIRAHLPKPSAASPASFPQPQHARHILLIEGCVQPVLSPHIDIATANVLDRLGISIQRTHIAQCCGAIEHHGQAKESSLNRIRNNIDLWLPYLENGAEAIVSSASACSLEIKEYAYLLRHDPDYKQKAAQISAACNDISEIIAAEDLTVLQRQRNQSVAFHAPCSLQHGQQSQHVVEDILQRAGYLLSPVANTHLCCGSAGTYAILQSEMANTLRDQKLDALTQAKPDIIASANIGCLHHLAGGTNQTVKHWVELL